MDLETLTLLLHGQHLNIPDRIARGLWPHPPLRFDDVLQHLAGILRREAWFPNPWQPQVPGQLVAEGSVIEKQGKHYIYRSQRAVPSNPFILAEEFERKFMTAEDAASHYLQWDLRLPGDLDGWKVVK
jgi:hypothetical protein